MDLSTDHTLSEFLRQGWRLSLSYSEHDKRFVATVMRLEPNTPVVEAMDDSPLGALTSVFSNFTMEVIEDGTNGTH